MDDYTRKFSIVDDKDVEIYNILTTVYQALEEKGYNPINQIVGYILSEDPTYITNHMGARTLIRKLDRDELLQVLVKNIWDSKSSRSKHGDVVSMLFLWCKLPKYLEKPLFWTDGKDCRHSNVDKLDKRCYNLVTIFPRECLHV